MLARRRIAFAYGTVAVALIRDAYQLGLLMIPFPFLRIALDEKEKDICKSGRGRGDHNMIIVGKAGQWNANYSKSRVYGPRCIATKSIPDN